MTTALLDYACYTYTSTSNNNNNADISLFASEKPKIEKQKALTEAGGRKKSFSLSLSTKRRLKRALLENRSWHEASSRKIELAAAIFLQL